MSAIKGHSPRNYTAPQYECSQPCDARGHRLVEPAQLTRRDARYFFTVTWMSFRYLTGWPFSIAGLYFQSRAAARSRLS
jgi:hypothetical protein